MAWTGAVVEVAWTGAVVEEVRVVAEVLMIGVAILLKLDS